MGQQNDRAYDEMAQENPFFCQINSSVKGQPPNSIAE